MGFGFGDSTDLGTGAKRHVAGHNQLSMYAVRRWTNHSGETPRIKMTAFTHK
jgi:hypothetical protein